MVSITASYIVIPRESTPQGFLWLSDLDQVARFRHTPTIYIYKPKQNPENAIETLKNSLSKILVYYYPMAGRLFYTEGGRLELNLNAKGAILLEAESNKSIHDYGDFSPSDATRELAVQLTRFKDNEGFAIGVSFSHILSDGLGAIRMMNSWAKIARGETLEDNELPFLIGRQDTNEEGEKKTSATLLRLSPEQVDKLKKKANGNGNENDILAMKNKGSRGFSRYEVISAHIWKSASRARELEENQESVVRFIVEIRNRIIPNLPENYFGNALIQTATKGLIGEIRSKPLGYVAQKIREAAEIVTDELIRSQIDVIRGFQHLDDARALYLGDEGKNIPFLGNPNFRINSWMSMPLYEADFGWGKPAYFGIARLYPHDRAFILLTPDEDGSILVCLHFQIAHLELFKKFFYEDI